jgi:hypothetical protein
MTVQEITKEKEAAERQITEIVNAFRRKLPAGVAVSQIRPLISAHSGIQMVIDLIIQ